MNEATNDGAHVYVEGSERCSRCWLTRAFIDRVKVTCPGQRAAGEEERPGLDPFWVGDHGHAEGWGHLAPQTFVESGLLQRINKDFLWPLGLALNVTVQHVNGERDYGTAVLCVISAEPPEPIVSAGRDRWEALMTFLDERHELIAAADGQRDPTRGEPDAE